MKPLIIFAHPGTIGHCSLILDEVLSFFRKNKIKYDLVDLYKIKYDPVLKAEELYTSGNRYVSKQNIKFQKMIKHTDKIIFIYPVWWGSMPAILKGFLDRVLTARYAYRFNKLGFPIKLLKGKAIVFTTSGGPKVGYILLNPAKIIIKYITLGLCGIKTKYYQFYNAKVLTEKNKNRIRTTVPKALIRFFE